LIYLGGGNAKHLCLELPENCRKCENIPACSAASRSGTTPSRAPRRWRLGPEIRLGSR